MDCTNSRSRNSVGPPSSTASSMMPARPMLRFDSHFRPRSSPDTTEYVAIRVITTMMPTSVAVLRTASPMLSRPAAICSTPRPSDVAIPKTVPTTATTSMASPNRPFTRSPSSGSSAHRMDTGRPLRWIAYATPRPTTT